MALDWIAVDAMTGYPICDLPDLSIPAIGAALCGYKTGVGTLPVAAAPGDWQLATAPWSSYLVLLDDGLPIWGCWVTRRIRSASETVSLSICTWENYLTRRYCGDTNYNNRIYTDIASGVVESFVRPDGPAFLVDVEPSASRGDLHATDDDDRTVLSVLSEMAGRDGGPEWTVDWRYLPGSGQYLPALRIAHHIGVSDGLPPAAVFDLPGCLTTFSCDEDWSQNKAANDVMATAIADGDTRLTSGHKTYIDPQRPRLEYRWTPSTSITERPALVNHADGRLAWMRDGSTIWSLTALASSAPRLGRDWFIGDEIGYTVAHSSVSPRGQGDELVPATGAERCIEWEATVSGRELLTITPGLYSEDKQN